MTMENEDDDLISCGTCQNQNDPGETHCGYCGEPLSDAIYPVYVEKIFSVPHRKIIAQAQQFLADYEAGGYKASLRQLYYQFVANVPDFPNTEQSYKRLGGIINDAKLAGKIAFDSMEDRGRDCAVTYVQDDLDEVLHGIEHQFAENYWADQDTYIEVWVEKDALSGVIQRPCRKFRVSYMACKGYMSGSALWEAGNRFKEAADRGKDCVLIHLGDHDPSGIDMTRDNQSRLSMFVGENVDIRRIGLNMDQIKRYNPPPNPTKVTDSRAQDYIDRFGYTCWELDALSPAVISALIEAEIVRYIDKDIWNTTLARERENKEVIAKIGQNARAVFDFVKDL
jgi:hypothetical protein